jgi:hypothetical protein
MCPGLLIWTGSASVPGRAGCRAKPDRGNDSGLLPRTFKNKEGKVEKEACSVTRNGRGEVKVCLGVGTAGRETNLQLKSLKNLSEGEQRKTPWGLLCLQN